MLLMRHTAVGTVATDLADITFTLSGSDMLAILQRAYWRLSVHDYEAQSENPVNLPYDGSTYDITATVTATDASDNAAQQEITVSIRDVGGIDDNTETGTGTNTSTATEGTAETDTATSTAGTGTATDSTILEQLQVQVQVQVLQVLELELEQVLELN